MGRGGELADRPEGSPSAMVWAAKIEQARRYLVFSDRSIEASLS
jgi:hypothetical protein